MSRYPPLLKIAIVLYAFAVALDLAGLGLGADWIWIQRIGKSLLMPALILFVWGNNKAGIRSNWLLLALFFSWLGDLFLMGSGPQWFILGLGSFLLAHLSYLAVFRVDDMFSSTSFLRKRPVIAVGVIGLGASLLLLLWPFLKEMKAPVAVYATVITVMALAGIGRYGNLQETPAKAVVIGVLLFMLSDSLLALNKFGQDLVVIPLAGIWVMVTYVLAQAAIVWGVTTATEGLEE